MENINNLKETNDELKKLTDKLKQIDTLKQMQFNFGIDPILNAMKLFDELDGNLKVISNGFKLLEKNNLSKALGDMSNEGSLLAKMALSAGDSIKTLAASTDIQTFASNLCTIASTALSAALNFLEKNPLVAVVGAIGLVVGALSLLSGYQDTAKTKTELLIEAQEKKRKELDDTTISIKENTKASVDSAKSAEIQSTVLRGYLDNLKGLADENGIVKNVEQAKYYIEEINDKMPGTVKLTEDNKIEWLKNSDAIEKNIKQLERKAKIDAYYDGYVESIKNEAKLRGELTLAQNNYNNELKNQNSLQNKFNELEKKRAEQGGTLSNEDWTQWHTYQNQLGESTKRLEGYGEVLDSAKSLYEANKQGADLYKYSVEGLDESVLASAQLQVEEMTTVGEKGTSTWDSLAAAREDCKNRIGTASGEELEVAKLTNALLNAETINKAMVFGTSCDDMITKLKERGVTMSAEEEEQLRASYDKWQISTDGIKNVQSAGLDTLSLMKNTAMSKMSDDEKDLLAESVKNFAEAGNNEGLGMCQKLSTALYNSKGEVNDEVRGILNDIKTQTENADNKTNVYAVENPGSAVLAFNGIQNRLIALGAATIPVVGVASIIKGYQFADGGFPDTGEMFIAREAGPELVGRINGKTAVANNDQIVSGISSGVYNAMIGALGSSHRANTTVTAIFQVDGKQVAKQVIQAHNKEVIQTGRSPLLV